MIYFKMSLNKINLKSVLSPSVITWHLFDISKIIWKKKNHKNQFENITDEYSQ